MDTSSVDSVVGVRGTRWAITINNPTDKEIICPEWPGWSLSGQMERGESGTLHYQAALKTPKVSWSTVKKAFPRAHIKKARNAIALNNYVHKPETRVALVPDSGGVPTLFEYANRCAARLDIDEIDKAYKDAYDELRHDNSVFGADTWLVANPQSKWFMEYYLDKMVAMDIEAGVRGVEYIAINPMWISAWKKFWRSIIKRHGSQQGLQGTQGTEGSEETWQGSQEGGTPDACDNHCD
jgi:hypothetical protein